MGLVVLMMVLQVAGSLLEMDANGMRCQSSEAVDKNRAFIELVIREHCSIALQLFQDVPEGPDAGVGGDLILGERGDDGGQRSDGAGSQQAGGGRGEGLHRVDNHVEGSVV
jgi:hypothetical protein